MHLMRIIIRMNKTNGKIIISSGLNVWDHELRAAEALANAGLTVGFIRKSEVDYQRTADVRIN